MGSGFSITIQFEVHAQELRFSTQSQDVDLSTFGLLLADCKHILNPKKDFSLHWTRRHANRVGHELARASFQFDNFCIWHEPYSFILDALFVDSLLSNEVSSLFSK